MRTPICDELGIEFPIFAFTHCRDVVVAVSKAGGFGVLGAVGLQPRAARDRAQLDRRAHRRPSLRRRHRDPQQVRGHGRRHVDRGPHEDAPGHGPAGPPRLRPQAAQRPRRPDARGRGQLAAAARLDRGHRDAAGRDRVAAPEDDADRQRAGYAPGRHDRAHPRRGSQGRGAVRLAVPGAQARRRRASTSSSPRVARAVVTAARSARSCCGRRSSRRWRRCRCSRPVGSAAARRSRRRSRSDARARGRARSG